MVLIRKLTPSIQLSLPLMKKVTLFSLALLTSVVCASEKNHALIVGIGQYSAASESSPLPGVPKDLETARKMALAMGIPASQITELRDSQATKSNIVSELERLRRRVASGEKVFIYFSGHGTSHETRDGCQQGIVPYTEGRHTQQDVLTEAELASYTSKISEKADKAVVMVDACFSGGLVASATRSFGSSTTIRPKVVTRSGDQCGVAVNQPLARSFAPAMQRLGVPQQNFVQISAANYNEVSWDSEQLGGLATHSLGECLLGDAKDLNSSGAITLEEVRQCAQEKLDRLMAPHKAAGMLPSSIQVRGSRNLIVVAQPPEPAPVAPPPVVQVSIAPPPAAPPTQSIAVSSPVPVPSEPAGAATGQPSRPIPDPAPSNPASSAPPPAPVVPEKAPEPALASLATLEEIFGQRNGRFRLDVTAPDRLAIGKDSFNFAVRSNLDGYLYAVLLGSDGKSFYLLFPNKLDQDNKIKANVLYRFPRPGWAVKAGGPAGTNRVLMVVSQAPRDVKVFSSSADSGGGPFTFSVADLSSRKRLVDFFVGRGVQGRNGHMAAALVKVDEVD